MDVLFYHMAVDRSEVEGYLCRLVVGVVCHYFNNLGSVSGLGL